MAVRIAISFCRPTARARSRLATLAQAMSSTKPTAATSTSSDCRTFCTAKSCSGFDLGADAVVALRVLRGQPVGDDVELRLRGRQVDAGLQPRDRRRSPDATSGSSMGSVAAHGPIGINTIGRLQQLEAAAA